MDMVTDFSSENAFLQALIQAQSSLLRHPSNRQPLTDLLQIVIQLTSSEFAFIGKYGESGKRPSSFLQVVTFASSPKLNWSKAFFEKSCSEDLQFRDLNNLIRAVFTTQKNVNSNNSESEFLCGGYEGHSPIESFLGIPLFHENALVGILALANRPSGYDQTLIQFLSPLVQAAPVMLYALRKQQGKEARQALLETREAQFHSVFSQVAVGLCIATIDCYIELANDAFCRLIGWSKSDLLGVNMWEFVHPEDMPSVEGVCQRAQAGEIDSFTCEPRMLRKDGTIVWTHVVSSTIRDSAGNMKYVLKFVQDISERKKNQAELEKLAMVVEQIDSLVLITDPHGNLEWVNPAFSQFTGFSFDEVIEKDLDKLFNRIELSPGASQKIEECVRQQCSLETETLNRGKGGNLFWLNTRIQPIFNGKKELIHFVSVETNISDRKAMEARLLQAQRETELILNAVGEGIYGTDLEGNATFINPEAARLLGFSREELRGSMHEIMHHTKPDGTPYPRKECLAIAPCKDGVTRFVHNEVFWRKDGSSFPVEYTTTCVRDSENHPIGAVVVFRDITARIQGEAELRKHRNHLEELVQKRTAELGKLSQAVKQSPVMVVITDRNAIIEYVNPKFTEVTGYSPEDVLGKNPRLLQSGSRTMASYQEMWETLRAGKTWTGAFQNMRKSGELYWESACISPLRDEHGDLTHFVAVKEDISERMAAEKALREAKTAADAASRAKSAFLANMSHEIRTPMHGILGFAQLLDRDSSLTVKQAEHVQAILRSGNHLLALINDVLDLSKIEAGGITVTLANFCWDDFLDDVEIMFCSRANAKNLQFRLERCPGMPRFVISDESKLRQILINLLGNAVKFTNKGEVILRARVEPVVGKAQRGLAPLLLSLEVEDTGSGIPEEDLARIFNAFHQANAGLKAGGTGLGLAISREFARLLGGDITVNSTVGKGSCFRVQILLESAALPFQHEKKVEGKRVVGLKPGFGPLRILVVDDVKENRTLLEALLFPIGFEVKEAANGVEALNAFKTWHPNIILMDMHMPIMDGYEAIRQLKATQEGRAVPVIAVTASVLGDAEDRVLEVGADSYLRKPFWTEELLLQIGKLLGLQYIFSEPVAYPPSTPKEMVSQVSLPHELLEALQLAVADGDMSRLADLIVQVREIDHAVASNLQKLANRFDYQRLTEWLLKTNRSESDE